MISRQGGAPLDAGAGDPNEKVERRVGGPRKGLIFWLLSEYGV